MNRGKIICFNPREKYNGTPIKLGRLEYMLDIEIGDVKFEHQITGVIRKGSFKEAPLKELLEHELRGKEVNVLEASTDDRILIEVDNSPYILVTKYLKSFKWNII